MEASVLNRRDVFAVSVAGVRLVIPSESVAGVVSLDSLTRVPRTPAYILGLLPHGEGALAVVDLEAFLDLPGRKAKDLHFSSQRVVIVNSGELEAGLVCDQAYGVTEMSGDAEPATVLKAGRLPEFVLQEFDSSDARVGVLDIAAVLEDARIVSRAS